MVCRFCSFPPCLPREMSPHSSSNSAYDLPVSRSPPDESAPYDLSNSGFAHGASSGDKRRTADGTGTALKDRRKSHGAIPHSHVAAGFDSAGQSAFPFSSTLHRSTACYDAAQVIPVFSERL